MINYRNISANPAAATDKQQQQAQKPTSQQLQQLQQEQT